MTITLKQIKSYDPCTDSWKRLLKGLNKTKADSEPLEFRNIYNILGTEDLFWATRVLDNKKRIHVGALFANTIKHLTKDKRVHDCIEVCFRYARGEATSSELENARIASFAATYDSPMSDFIANVATYAAYGEVSCVSEYTAYTTAISHNYREVRENLALIFLDYIEEV